MRLIARTVLALLLFGQGMQSILTLIREGASLGYLAFTPLFRQSVLVVSLAMLLILTQVYRAGRAR